MLSKRAQKYFFIWTIIFLIFIFDVYFERFSGANIFGWGATSLNGVPQPHGERIVSFFKDEPIDFFFINGFIFILLGYLLNVLKNKKYRNIIFLITILIFFMSVLITGERSNTIKSLIWINFIYILDIFDFKSKIYFFIVLPTIDNYNF